MYKEKDVIVRAIKKSDITRLWELIHKDEDAEWRKWDAPYFDDDQPLSYEEFIISSPKLIDCAHRWVIEVNGVVVGTVNYYWEHKPTKWLEIGIGIYDSTYWNGGYGTIALKLWIGHIFNTIPVARVGYTTWSGNERMVRVGEKLGMVMEARMRKCRFYNGTYYDSISMVILREEWVKTIKVRRLTYQDTETLYLVAEIHENMPRKWIKNYRVTEESINGTNETLLNKLKKTNIFCTVIELNEELLSYIWAEVNAKNEKQIDIISLWTKEQYRGKGYAKTLKLEVEKWALKEMKAEKIHTTVSANNELMLRLNEKLGYTTEYYRMTKELKS